MRKYPVRFTTNYTNVQGFTNQKKVDLCNKWKGKSLTLSELEQHIDEFGEVVFDGKTIEIYNDYRE